MVVVTLFNIDMKFVYDEHHIDALVDKMASYVVHNSWQVFPNGAQKLLHTDWDCFDLAHISQVPYSFSIQKLHLMSLDVLSWSISSHLHFYLMQGVDVAVVVHTLATTEDVYLVFGLIHGDMVQRIINMAPQKK